MSFIENRLLAKCLKRSPPDLLPPFAMWSVELGRRLLDAQRAGSPRVVTLVVPSRQYASAFIALGALDAAIRTAPTTSPEPRVGSHVRAVLPGGKVLVGEYLGKETRPVLNKTADYFVVGLKGKQRQLVPVDAAHLETLEIDNAKITGFEGSSLPDWFKIAESAYGVELLSVRLANLENVATVLGIKSTLLTEFDQLDFHVEAQAESISMSKLLFTAPGKFFETEVRVLAGNANLNEYEESSLVILDGERASALDWGDQSVVVILEPTTTSFTSSASNLQSGLQFLSPDHDWPSGFSHPAPRIEWTCHRR